MTRSIQTTFLSTLKISLIVFFGFWIHHFCPYFSPYWFILSGICASMIFDNIEYKTKFINSVIFIIACILILSLIFLLKDFFWIRFIFVLIGVFIFAYTYQFYFMGTLLSFLLSILMATYLVIPMSDVVFRDTLIIFLLGFVIGVLIDIVFSFTENKQSWKIMISSFQEAYLKTLDSIFDYLIYHKKSPSNWQYEGTELLKQYETIKLQYTFQFARSLSFRICHGHYTRTLLHYEFLSEQMLELLTFIKELNESSITVQLKKELIDLKKYFKEPFNETYELELLKQKINDILQKGRETVKKDRDLKKNWGELLKFMYLLEKNYRALFSRTYNNTTSQKTIIY